MTNNLASNEAWKPIPGLNGKYEASSHGRIRKILSFSKWEGYWTVDINRRRQLVHRLVCATFGNDPHGLVVNHKNGVKTDNRPENLEPVTSRENTIHAALLGLLALGERNGSSKITAEIVSAIRESKEPHRVLMGRFGLSKSQISRIRKGHSWKHIPGALPAGTTFRPTEDDHRAGFKGAKVSLNGVSKTVSQWAQEGGISYGTLRSRIYRERHPIGKALVAPVTRITNRKLSNEEIQHIQTSKESQTILAVQFGIHQSTISRIQNGKRWRNLK